MHAKKCRWKCVGWWPICNFCVCVFCALQVYAPWCCWWLQGEQPWFARLWGYILFFLCVFHQVCLWSVAWRINSQPWVSCSTYTVGNHTQHTKLRSLSILKFYCSPSQTRLWCGIWAYWTIRDFPSVAIVVCRSYELCRSHGLPINLTLIFNQITSKFKSTALLSSSLVGFKLPDSSLDLHWSCGCINLQQL